MDALQAFPLHVLLAVLPDEAVLADGAAPRHAAVLLADGPEALAWLSVAPHAPRRSAGRTAEPRVPARFAERELVDAFPCSLVPLAELCAFQAQLSEIRPGL